MDVVKLARVRVRYSATVIVYSTIYMHFYYIVTFLLSDKRGVIRLRSERFDSPQLSPSKENRAPQSGF